MAQTPIQPKTYSHSISYIGAHDFPRWNRMKCTKCQRLYAVHDSDLGTWAPPLADCPYFNDKSAKATNHGSS